MENIYLKLTEAKTDEFDFEGYLKKIDQYEIFKPVFDEYADLNLAINIVKFILYGYTPESDMLMENGGSWDKISKQIFARVDIPEEYIEDVCHFKNKAVQDAILNWISFLNDDAIISFFTARNLRSEMIRHALSEAKKGDELDIKAKMDAAKYADDLLEMMDRAKARFIQSNPKLRGSIEGLEKKVKIKHTIGPQSFAK